MNIGVLWGVYSIIAIPHPARTCTRPPIPLCFTAWQGGDAHVLVVDRDNGMLYETYASSYDAATGHWKVGMRRKRGQGSTWLMFNTEAKQQG